MSESNPAHLSAFFNPRGVAVVGASSDPIKLGYGLARNLAQSGYRGAVHFVNLHGGTLFGRPVYPRLADVPDPVDLAVLLIPAAAVPEAIRECGRRGIPAAIIAAGGFREVGPQGAALEAECLQAAQEGGLRLLGPNCIGLLDTHLPLDTTFLPPPGPPQGDVAFLSHSGAICAAVIDWARGQGFGLSRLVSLGNQADLTETELLAPLASDRHTQVITLYLEGVSDGRRFVEEARRVARRKPVIALKVGRFESGQRAVASHTGALAGRESAFNAAFRRAGVIRAESSEEMFDWARALAWCALPAGREMAVLTNAGGPGVTAADALEGLGLRLAALQPETRTRLQATLPPAASLNNPVDMLASASPQQYRDCLGILLADPGVHGVLVILPPPPMYTAGEVAQALIPVIHAAARPVVAALMGDTLIQEAVERFRAARIPEYRFPERAASALAVLAERAERLAAPEDGLPRPADIDQAAARRALDSGAAGQFLPPEAAAALLAAYRIPLAPLSLAQTAGEAAELAAAMGFPAALKVASPDISHKSEAGGVLLNLNTPAQVRVGFRRLLRRVQAARPGAALLGAHVQRMLPPGQEVIAGVVQDAQFGPVVMFGSGGVEVEGLKDVAFALAPLSAADAAYLLQATWAGRRLAGYRNLPPADRQAVLETLARLAWLAADFPEIAEIEINPLRVFPAGQGAIALDARALLKPATP